MHAERPSLKAPASRPPAAEKSAPQKVVTAKRAATGKKPAGAQATKSGATRAATAKRSLASAAKPAASEKRYHHGDLRRALLDAAAELIAEQGPAALSLREVARKAGVSHGAPAHHFRDKAGMLTALASEGFTLFAQAMRKARDRAGDDAVERFAATGVAYVLFARDHRRYFEIMFRADLLTLGDPALHAASSDAYGVLYECVLQAQAAGYESALDPTLLATRSWSLTHGLATLWLQGNLSKLEQPHQDLEELAKSVVASYAASGSRRP